jgi:hypothetical protein
VFGPDAGAVTLALDNLVRAWPRRFTFQQTCFNFGCRSPAHHGERARHGAIANCQNSQGLSNHLIEAPIPAILAILAILAIWQFWQSWQFT